MRAISIRLHSIQRSRSRHSMRSRKAAQAGGASAVALSGDEVNTAVAQGSSDFEIQLILVMAVIVILGLLLLTSEAWFEPVLFLSVIGISIVYNLGTNIIFGEISFITQMCAAILQLAVSMDYGIVMLHEYRHFKQEGCSSYDAALAGMHKASGVIASSAATTFFGFLSLCAMAFLIGADMGVVLAKGIVFSFLSVLFILPVMVLLSEKLLQRTAHRKFLPSFDKFAKWCVRLSIPFTLIAALIVVPAFLGSRNTEYVYGASGFVEPGSQLYEDTELIEETFNASGQCAVLVPEGQWGKEKELVAALDTLPHVSSITSYVTTVSERIPTDMVPPASLESLISGGYSRIIIATDLRGESPEAFELVQRIRDLCQLYYPDEAKLVGSTVTSYDMSLIVNDDSARVLFASIIAIGLVLLVMFRSLSIPLILVAHDRELDLDQPGHSLFCGRDDPVHRLPHHQCDHAGSNGRLHDHPYTLLPRQTPCATEAPGHHRSDLAQCDHDPYLSDHPHAVRCVHRSYFEQRGHREPRNAHRARRLHRGAQHVLAPADALHDLRSRYRKDNAWNAVL